MRPFPVLTLTKALPCEGAMTAIDAEGFVQHGFEIGQQDVRVGLYNVAAQRLRIWMVPRQHDWRVDDAIRPVAYVDATPKRTGVTSVIVARRKTLRPGAYDFIARPLRYGFEDDELRFRRGDLVSGRWTTGLVIREPFMPENVTSERSASVHQLSLAVTL